MTVTTDESKKMNVFAKEPQMYITEEDMARHEEQTYAEKAELYNSRAAMLGILAGFISYALTGKLFFGVF